MTTMKHNRKSIWTSITIGHNKSLGKTHILVAFDASCLVPMTRIDTRSFAFNKINCRCIRRQLRVNGVKNAQNNNESSWKRSSSTISIFWRRFDTEKAWLVKMTSWGRRKWRRTNETTLNLMTSAKVTREKDAPRCRNVNILWRVVGCCKRWELFELSWENYQNFIFIRSDLRKFPPQPTSHRVGQAKVQRAFLKAYF